MKTCAAPAAPKFSFNMRLHKTEIAAMKAMKATKARAANPKIKFNMKIHLPAAAEKAEIVAKMATKAVAKKATKAKKANVFVVDCAKPVRSRTHIPSRKI